MAVGNWTVFANAKLQMSKKAIDLSADTFVMVLLSNAYSPAVNTDAAWSTMSADELTTAGGYTAGGVVLTSVTDTLSGAAVTWAAASSTWATFTATFKYGMLVHRAGGSLTGTDIPIAYFDASTGGGSVTGAGGTLTITNPSGLIVIS